jgi:urocanate hydratase
MITSLMGSAYKIELNRVYGSLLLCRAAHHNRVDIVNAFINAAFDIDRPDIDSNQSVCHHSHPVLLPRHSFLHSCLELTQKQPSNYPLLAAASVNAVECVAALVSRNVNTNVVNAVYSLWGVKPN